MDREEKLRALRKKNPFVSVSAGDPWELAYPDVEEVNREPFEGLAALIRELANHPGTNCAGLVLGEVGSGKTHLISRLLELGRQGDPLFVFAYVQPIEDPDQTFRYLLRETVINLCRPLHRDANVGASALDLLVARILVGDVLNESVRGEGEGARRTLQHLRRDPLRVFRMGRERLSRLKPKGIAFMRRSFGEMSGDMARALFAYADPETRADAANWLKGAVLDDEDAERLGVQSRSDYSGAALEQEARDVLASLGRLLARYRIPLLTCFDRLENLETPEQIRAQGKMLEFLVDSVRSVLPVMFARGLQWEETIRYRFNQHVVSRLEGNQFELAYCTPEQALTLVRERLRSAFGVEALDDLSPFDEAELREAFSVELSPREVISQANRKLRRILRQKPVEKESAEEKLRREFKSQLEAVRGDLDSHPPDRGRMRRALELYLGNVLEDGKAAWAESVARPANKDKYVDLEVLPSRERKGAKGLLIIDTELHHASVRAALKRGVQHLEKNPDGFALYIRDSRCGFPEPPKWKATNKMLETFRAKGGIALFLDPEQAAAWYALALLAYAVREGDISLPDSGSGSRSVSWLEFREFISSGLRDEGVERVAAQLRQIAQSKEKEDSGAGQEGSGDVDAEQTAEAAARLLRDRPMYLAPVSEVAAELPGDFYGGGEKRLLRILKGYPDRFEIVRARDASLVKLKREWLHEQGERV